MKKLGIWGIAIAAAFVAGSLVTGSMAFADKGDKNNPVAQAIDRLTAVMQETTTQGPEGPQGETGPQGEQGPTGPEGLPGFSSIIKTIPDCNCNPRTGWSPPSSGNVVTDSDVTVDSFIAIMVKNSDESVCTVSKGSFASVPLNDNQFVVQCAQLPGDGAELTYMIVNP